MSYALKFHDHVCTLRSSYEASECRDGNNAETDCENRPLVMNWRPPYVQFTWISTRELAIENAVGSSQCRKSSRSTVVARVFKYPGIHEVVVLCGKLSVMIGTDISHEDGLLLHGMTALSVASAWIDSVSVV